MRFITLTNPSGNPIYVNPDHIGHIYEVKEVMEYGSIKEPGHTRVGITTHNNGGFKVKESAKAILKLIEQNGK